MRNYNLPFRIGEQYEAWEFDLEVLPDDKIKGCDGYIYLKNYIFLNITPLKTELIFSFDILVVVIMTINTKDLVEMRRLINLLGEVHGEYIEHQQEFFSACIYKLGGSDELWLIYKPVEDETYITYGKSKLISELYCT